MRDVYIKDYYSLSLDELYLILNGRQEVFAIEQGIVYQDMDFIDQDSVHLLIKDIHKGSLISYLRIIKPGVKYPEVSIGRLLTMPCYRNNGYARKIMSIGIQEAIKRFGLPIKIDAQEYLVEFYESLGFKQISKSFILEGISHVEMILYNFSLE